jgi:hypothetical protein
MKPSIIVAVLGLSVSVCTPFVILFLCAAQRRVSSAKGTSLRSEEKEKLKSFAVEALPANAKKLDNRNS